MPLGPVPNTLQTLAAPQDLPGSLSITDSQHHAHLGPEGFQTGQKGAQQGSGCLPIIRDPGLTFGIFLADRTWLDCEQNRSASLTSVDIVHAVWHAAIVL